MFLGIFVVVLIAFVAFVLVYSLLDHWTRETGSVMTCFVLRGTWWKRQLDQSSQDHADPGPAQPWWSSPRVVQSPLREINSGDGGSGSRRSAAGRGKTGARWRPAGRRDLDVDEEKLLKCVAYTIDDGRRAWTTERSIHIAVRGTSERPARAPRQLWRRPTRKQRFRPTWMIIQHGPTRCWRAGWPCSSSSAVKK